jgi:RNA polymerase sigma-70 factor (ECF subfamily)
METLAELELLEPSPDDAAIVTGVLAGDVPRFAQLVSRYQAPLYRYAVSIVLDHDVAADMVQDAFVRVYTNLHSCRDRTRFRAWLFQTLRNRCLDYLKEARRRDVSLDAVSPVARADAGPDERADRLRLRADLRAALQSLPDAQREAFLLHYVHGLPYDTMAGMLRQSTSAMKMRVFRARQALTTALRDRDVTSTGQARLTVRRADMLHSLQSQEE